MIAPILLQPGAAGVPLTIANVLAFPLAGKVRSYTHTISAMGGFESASVVIPITDDDEYGYWCDQLFCDAVMIGPDAEVVWNGYLTRVTLRVGSKARSRGLDSMANRVNVRYTTYLGNQTTTGTSSNSGSQARYGVKEAILSLNETSSTHAQNVRAQYLAAHAWPEFEPTTTIDPADRHPGYELELEFAGWYQTLAWLTTSVTTTSTAVTTTQVGTLLTSYAATNAWISTDTSQIVASGISETQYIAPDTTYTAAIERLLSAGNGTNRYAWGIYENRRFRANVWAGATPTSLATVYLGDLGRGTIYQNGGMVQVAPYNVRPDAIYLERDLLDITMIGSQPDAAARHYVERVTYQEERGAGWSLALEGQSTDDVSARIAHLSGR